MDRRRGWEGRWKGRGGGLRQGARRPAGAQKPARPLPAARCPRPSAERRGARPARAGPAPALAIASRRQWSASGTVACSFAGRDGIHDVVGPGGIPFSHPGLFTLILLLREIQRSPSRSTSDGTEAKYNCVPASRAKGAGAALPSPDDHETNPWNGRRPNDVPGRESTSALMVTPRIVPSRPTGGDTALWRQVITSELLCGRDHQT